MVVAAAGAVVVVAAADAVVWEGLEDWEAWAASARLD